MYRKLIWEPSGFRPEGYNWSRFRVSKSNSLLRHDVYEHHQPLGDSVTEFTTFGAIAKFNDYDTFLLWVPTIIRMSRRIKPNGTRYQFSLPDRIADIFYYELGTNNPTYYAHLFQIGYNHAKRFPIEAYQKFGDIDFVRLHEQERDIIVDLMRGIII